MTSTSAGVRDSARAANRPPKPQPTMTICAGPPPVNTPSAQPSPSCGGDYQWLQARTASRIIVPRHGPQGDNNMPGNDATAPPRRRSRLPGALTSMPAQLVLLFVVLTAIDLACQWLGARLVHAAPAPLRDAARLLAALILAVAMIAAYRFLVRILEGRTAEELESSGAVRALVPGVLVGAGLFALVFAVLWALGTVTFGGSGGFAGVGRAFATAIAAAVGEEIVFRGVVYRRLEER